MRQRTETTTQEAHVATNPAIHSVTTTAGERFSAQDSANLAHLIWRRFGKDYEAGVVAWRRLLQNSCPLEDFRALVAKAEE
jgi:hypothetical protein